MKKVIERISTLLKSKDTIQIEKWIKYSYVTFDNVVTRQIVMNKNDHINIGRPVVNFHYHSKKTRVSCVVDIAATNFSTPNKKTIDLYCDIQSEVVIDGEGVEARSKRVNYFIERAIQDRIKLLIKIKQT